MNIVCNIGETVCHIFFITSICLRYGRHSWCRFDCLMCITEMIGKSKIGSKPLMTMRFGTGEVNSCGPEDIWNPTGKC